MTAVSKVSREMVEGKFVVDAVTSNGQVTLIFNDGTSMSFTASGVSENVAKTVKDIVVANGSVTVIYTDGTTSTLSGLGGKTYISSEIALSSATYAYGPYAHGLGSAPAYAHAFFKCKVANNGYAVGDLIPVSRDSTYGSGSGMSACLVYVNDTDIGFVRSTYGYLTINNKTTGASVDSALTNWSVILVASADVTSVSSGSTGPVGPTGPAGSVSVTDYAIGSYLLVRSQSSEPAFGSTSTVYISNSATFYNAPNNIFGGAFTALSGTWKCRGTVVDSDSSGNSQYIVLYQRTA